MDLSSQSAGVFADCLRLGSATGRINSVDLKHVLGDIQTDRGNLHVDGSLM
jgi:hypothetical protein